MHDSLFLENICKKSWIIYQVGGTNTDFIYRVLYIRFSHFTTKSNKLYIHDVFMILRLQSGTEFQTFTIFANKSYRNS